MKLCFEADCLQAAATTRKLQVVNKIATTENKITIYKQRTRPNLSSIYFITCSQAEVDIDIYMDNIRPERF